MKKIILLVFILESLCINKINAQIYYGEKDFGKIEFVNDSTFTISFINEFLYDQIDTCFYKKNKDTIFLFSKDRKLYEVKINDKKQPVGQGDPILIKEYSNIRGKYQLMSESILIYDTVNNQIVFNDYELFPEDILVINRYGYRYNRLIWKYKSSKYFTIKDVNYSGFQHIFFDNFPLLIRGNRLIPIDKEKNEECWVENGFYFPTMKKSQKEKKYKTIGYWSIGLRGLPSGFDIK